MNDEQRRGVTAAYEVHAVLTELGIDARIATADDGDADLVLPGPLYIDVKEAARPTLEQLARDGIDGRRNGLVTVVVADRLSPDVRTLLVDAGAGWLERAGSLRLVAGGFHIDHTIKSLLGPETQPVDPLARESGLTVALELLSNRSVKSSMRDLARSTDLSVGSVHRALVELKGLGHLAEDGEPRSTLFWATTQAWRLRWFPILEEPTPDAAPAVQRLLRFNTAELDGPGWAQAGDSAAAFMGAPIGSEALPRFLVPDQRALTWTLRTFELSPDERLASALVAVPPSQLAVRHRRPGVVWPTAHPMILAIGLASSGPRGREVLQQWSGRPEGVPDDW